jgi:hypothetical protein
MPIKKPGIVFFRNDDVNIFDDTFARFVEFFIAHSIPLVLAVEPANLTAETVRYLSEAQTAYPSLIEIVQHGWSHAVHDRGEFGGNRGYADQQDDIRRGLDVMRASFGEAFFPAFSFPFGQYNECTVRILNELGYLVLSSKFNSSFRAQLFYWFGRLARKKWMFDHRISYHLGRYPGTGLEEISVSLSPIRKYLGGHASMQCEFESVGTLRTQYSASRKRTPVVGIVLHHRYHANPDGMSLLVQFVDWLAAFEGARFMTLRDISRVLHPGTAQLQRVA